MSTEPPHPSSRATSETMGELQIHSRSPVVQQSRSQMPKAKACRRNTLTTKGRKVTYGRSNSIACIAERNLRWRGVSCSCDMVLSRGVVDVAKRREQRGSAKFEEVSIERQASQAAVCVSSAGGRSPVKRGLSITSLTVLSSHAESPLAQRLLHHVVMWWRGRREERRREERVGELRRRLTCEMDALCHPHGFLLLRDAEPPCPGSFHCQ